MHLTLYGFYPLNLHYSHVRNSLLTYRPTQRRTDSQLNLLRTEWTQLKVKAGNYQDKTGKMDTNKVRKTDPLSDRRPILPSILWDSHRMWHSKVLWLASRDHQEAEVYCHRASSGCSWASPCSESDTLWPVYFRLAGCQSVSLKTKTCPTFCRPIPVFIQLLKWKTHLK